MACVSESGVHCIEAVLNNFYRNNLFPLNGSFKELLEKGGYINANGDIELSVPFIAGLAGTTHQGLAMDTFWEMVNKVSWKYSGLLQPLCYGSHMCLCLNKV